MVLLISAAGDLERRLSKMVLTSFVSRLATIGSTSRICLKGLLPSTSAQYASGLVPRRCHRSGSHHCTTALNVPITSTALYIFPAGDTARCNRAMSVVMTTSSDIVEERSRQSNSSLVCTAESSLRAQPPAHRTTKRWRDSLFEDLCMFRSADHAKPVYGVRE